MIRVAVRVVRLYDLLAECHDLPGISRALPVWDDPGDRILDVLLLLQVRQVLSIRDLDGLLLTTCLQETYLKPVPLILAGSEDIENRALLASKKRSDRGRNGYREGRGCGLVSIERKRARLHRIAFKPA